MTFRDGMRRLTPQPLIGIGIMGVALVVMAGLWQAPGSIDDLPGQELFLAPLLLGAMVTTFRFPVHIETSTKVYLTGIVLFLVTVLLHPPLAAAVACAGLLVGETMARSRTGKYPSDMATDVGRLTLVASLASLTAHLPLHNPALAPALMVAAGVVLGIGDIVTFPLGFTPMTGVRPDRVIVEVFRLSGPMLGIQYLTALLGACAAHYQLWTVFLLVLPLAFVYRAFKQTKELHDETRDMLVNLADTVDLRDTYTGGHSKRVTEFTRLILQQMGKNGPEVDLIISAARVHDIGKIGIPDGILNKPGPLAPEERAIMESHSARGADFLARYADFVRGVAIVRHHHEAWDGTGYPDGRMGTEIPFGARVIAVADSFDAMTSDRPYRSGMPVARAAAILADGRGKQWEAAIVDAFLSTLTQSSELPLVQNGRSEVRKGSVGIALGSHSS